MNPIRQRRRQRAAAAVEFAAGLVLFFVFVFGIIELARFFYLRSTMVEVTRRAARMAANTDLMDPAKMSALRIKANLGLTKVPLSGPELSHANLSIDYLNAQRNRVDPKFCGAQNLINCSKDSQAANCIRFVRVRLCATDAGAACPGIAYVPMIGQGLLPTGGWAYPPYTTLTPVGSLGHVPGQTANCP